MDLTHSEADEQFRQEFRAWLDENLPAEWRTAEFWASKTSDEAFDLRREWERNKALRRLGRHPVAEGVRRPRRHPDAEGDLRRGDGPRARAR